MHDTTSTAHSTLFSDMGVDLEAELKQILNASRRLWWIPLLLGLILASVTWAADNAMSSSYIASTQLVVFQPVAGQNSVSGEGQQIQTYLQLVESGPVLDRVIIEFGLDMTRFDLASKIETPISSRHEYY